MSRAIRRRRSARPRGEDPTAQLLAQFPERRDHRAERQFLAPRAIDQARAGRAGVRRAVERRAQRLELALGDEGVAVQQQHEPTRRRPDADVVGSGEAHVLRQPDQPDVGPAVGDRVRGAIGGPVVHHDQIPRSGGRMGMHGRQAGKRVALRVERDDDDGEPRGHPRPPGEVARDPSRGAAVPPAVTSASHVALAASSQR